MENSLPATDISCDAAFLLRVIPNMVRWVYEGAWEPSSIIVWVLAWFGPWYNRFELRTLLHSNSTIIARSAFVIELTSSPQGVRHSYYCAEYPAELYLRIGDHLQVIILWRLCSQPSI